MLFDEGTIHGNAINCGVEFYGPVPAEIFSQFVTPLNEMRVVVTRSFADTGPVLRNGLPSFFVEGNHVLHALQQDFTTKRIDPQVPARGNTPG